MKKKYTKPYIYIESFQLDAALASGCSPEFAGHIQIDESKCGFDVAPPGDDKEFMFFNWNNCSVDLTGSEDGHDTTCYHGPTLSGGITFFTS